MVPKWGSDSVRDQSFNVGHFEYRPITTFDFRSKTNTNKEAKRYKGKFSGN